MVFVITRFVHARIFVSSNDLGGVRWRWWLGVWCCSRVGSFALKILLLI